MLIYIEGSFWISLPQAKVLQKLLWWSMQRVRSLTVSQTAYEHLKITVWATQTSLSSAILYSSAKKVGHRDSLHDLTHLLFNIILYFHVLQ